MAKLYPRLLVVVFLCSCLPAMAGDEMGMADLLFFKNHFAITAGVNLPVMSSSTTNGKAMHLMGLPGAYAGFRYTANFHKNFGIITGFELGLQSIRYNFTTPQFQAGCTNPQPYIGIPALINPRFCVKDRHVIGFVVGAELHYYLPVYYQAEYDNGPVNGNFSINYSTAKTNPFIQPVIGFNYGLILKNMNLIAIDLRYSIGNKLLAEGKYMWRVNDIVIDQGVIHAPDSYLTVGVCYTFTRAAYLKQKMHDHKLEPVE